MTREEAVARIKDHIEIHGCHERNAVKIFEALDMAIKALEQPEQLQDRCEGCYYKNGMGYQCDSCARYFPDRYTPEREE